MDQPAGYGTASMVEQPVPSCMPRRRRPWLWVIFAGSAVGCTYLHELGHCIPAWVSGYPAVPTPVKTYVLAAVTNPVQRAIALGGILGTVLASWGALCIYLRSRRERTSAALAGALLAPGFYSLRFLLAGRGHDGTEFQDAQAALGLSFSGHALDWFFLVSLIAIALVWLLKSQTRPGIHILRKWLKGAVLGLLLLMGLQKANNMIFDPILEHRQPHPIQETKR